MLRLSFLLISLFVTHHVFAYTVVLKSGKMIDGQLVGEDLHTIQLKDISGVLLSFRKELLDLRSMEAANQPSSPDNSSVQASKPGVRKPERSLVDVAREAKARRTGKARVIRAEDLTVLPELTVLGTADTESSAAPGRTPSGDGRQPERYWRQTSRSLRKDLEQLQEKKWSAQDRCLNAESSRKRKKTELHREPIDLASVMRESGECLRVRELEEQIRQAQVRLDDFLELARRSEVPRQWVE